MQCVEGTGAFTNSHIDIDKVLKKSFETKTTQTHRSKPFIVKKKKKTSEKLL